MSNVININDHRKKFKQPSIEELAIICADELLDDWQRFVRTNRLNQFFISSVPLHSREDVNYLQDISALSVIESKIGLTLILLAPGSTTASRSGWVASFTVQDKRIETPFMVSEQYARCFNVLLYLKLGRAMSQAGLISQ